MKHIMLAGSVTVFVMIMLGMIIGFYMMGYKQPAIVFFENTISGSDVASSNFNVSGFLKGISDAVLSPFGMSIIGMTILFSVISIFAGSNVGMSSFIGFFIPIFILFAVANIFFFPIVGFMQAEGLADFEPLSLIIAAVFNILLMLTVVEFISGRN